MPLPVPVRRLVLNDVGPAIEWESLERIGSYVGKGLQFPNFESAAAAMRLISEGFGPHSDEQWSRLSQAMIKPDAQGGVVLHYDPRIAMPMAQMACATSSEPRTTTGASTFGSTSVKMIRHPGSPRARAAST